MLGPEAGRRDHHRDDLKSHCLHPRRKSGDVFNRGQCLVLITVITISAGQSTQILFLSKIDYVEVLQVKVVVVQ